MRALREFDSAHELRAFYRGLRARLDGLRPPAAAPPLPAAPEPEPEPEPAPPPPAAVPEPEPPVVLPIRAQALQQIILAAASELGIPPELARSRIRRNNAVLLRHTVMLLTRKIAGWSFPEIGKALGGRDHSTVVHGVGAIQRRMAADPALAGKIESLMARLEAATQREGGNPREAIDPTETVLSHR
jgi:hypothetical protein